MFDTRLFATKNRQHKIYDVKRSDGVMPFGGGADDAIKGREEKNIYTYTNSSDYRSV